MKKTLALLLALVMLLSLVACATKQAPQTTETPTTEEQVMTKDELIEKAISVTILDLQNAVYDNKAKARMTYCDIPVAVTGRVLRIEDNYALICDSQVMLEAYLPLTDLARIATSDRITVVGIITDIQDVEIQHGGMPFTSPHYIMETAYLVD